MVPKTIQRRVWAAYNALPHGPEGNCLRVSKEWIAAVDAAEEAVKQKLEASCDQAQKKNQAPLRLPGV